MSEKLVPAKNGMFTFYRDRHAVHSRYDPVLEAEKYVASLDLTGRGGMDGVRCFILVEPGLGYIIPVLRKTVPAAKIIVLHCSVFFDGNTAFVPEAGDPALSWSPASKICLEDFLEQAVPDSEADQVRVIEWRPAAEAYGGMYLDIFRRTVDFIRRAAAGKSTVRAFGARWLRNALRSLNMVRAGVVPGRMRRALVVCASGPGLERDMPELAAWRASPSPPFLAAVSSAAPCLVSAGLFPDMVVSTDGGAWALLHLAETLRNPSETPGLPLFAVSLTAALPSQISEYPVLLLADGSFWQRYLLRSAGAPFLVFPQRGTVSASALDLAFFLTEGPVYVSGLDLDHSDLITHCCPYAFDRLREERACRLNPSYSQAFAREGMIRSGGTLGIYASWFRKELPKYPQRLYALSENRLGIGRLPWKAAAGKVEASGSIPPARILRLREGGKKAAASLTAALRDSVTGKRLFAELGELLGSGTVKTADDIAKWIENFCLKGTCVSFHGVIRDFARG